MSFISKSEDTQKTSWKKYILPGYIVVSALFIIYFIYASIVGGIYTVALNSGAQQGYAQAISELITQATQQDCKPVAINLGDTNVEVINVACLQSASAEPQASQPVSSTQE